MKRKEREQHLIDFNRWADSLNEYIVHLPYNDKIELYFAAKKDLPLDFPLRPSGWEGLSDMEKQEYLDEIDYVVDSQVGHKGIQRYHYTQVMGYTDLQFEDWWDSQEY
jgi:hypothetical protein